MSSKWRDEVSVYRQRRVDDGLVFIDDRLKEIVAKIAHMLAVLLAKLKVHALICLDQRGRGAGGDQRLVEFPFRFGPETLEGVDAPFALDLLFNMPQLVVGGSQLGLPRDTAAAH